MPLPDLRGIYFNSAHLGDPSFEYVCWLDVMGTENQMLRSLPIAANFIFKLHCAVLAARDELEEQHEVTGLRIYPVMDGVYITSRRRTPLQFILTQAMRRVVAEFQATDKQFHRFLARGAISFGPVYHGADLQDETSDALAAHGEIRDSILLGLPMAQAYREERQAPPFGIAVHSSATEFAPAPDKPFRYIWLDWYRTADPAVDIPELLKQLSSFFEWQTCHHNMTGYDPERSAHHQQLAKEFFTSGD
jgi:hypothetical protein